SNWRAASAQTLLKRSTQISRSRCSRFAVRNVRVAHRATATGSIFPLEKIICECVERVAFFTESRQGSVRLLRESFRFDARLVQTDDRRVSRFLRGDVFAGALTELLAGLGYIENVVAHLIRQTECASSFRDPAELCWI